MNLTWRLSNAIMCLFFGLASYVQHNDEYALFWITVYALPCLITLAIVLNCKMIYCHIFHQTVYILLSLYIIFSLYLFYRAVYIVVNDGQYNLFAYQEGKELFGVLIIQAWFLFTIYFLNARIPFDAIMNPLAKSILLILAISPLAMWIYHGCGFGLQQPELVVTRMNNNSGRIL